MNRKMLAPIIIGILIAFYMMIWISSLFFSGCTGVSRDPVWHPHAGTAFSVDTCCQGTA